MSETLHAHIKHLQDRLKQAEKERDDLKHDIERHLGICSQQAEEIERFREALRPFADHARGKGPAVIAAAFARAAELIPEAPSDPA